MVSRAFLRGLVIFVAAGCTTSLAFAAPIGVAWRDNLDAAKIEAAQTQRLLLLHFYTPSCAPCKVLDQNVLSQPQVGAAVERDYVPVKINADVSPALQQMFRIDRVPTDVVLTPQGNVVATLSTPDNPDGYIAQLQNLARHFRQTTPGNAPAATVNSAYASLPSTPPAVPQRPAGLASPVSASTPPAAAHAQMNPFLGGAPVLAPGQAVAGATAPNGALSRATVTAAPGANTVAAGGDPSMPTTAMPRSYRNPVVPGAAAPVTTTATPATSSLAATPTTNSAYAGIGVPTLPSSSPVTAAAPATVAGTPAAVATEVAAAPGQVVQPQPTQPPLPAGCPPVAFDGCCPVTLKLLNKWEPGNTAFGAIHRGRTYLFTGDEQRRQFLANPDSFSPVFAGYDPVLLLDRKQSVPGSRKFGFRYGDAFYLFSSAETRDRFQASPHTYAAGVRQAMARVDGGPSGIIRR